MAFEFGGPGEFRTRVLSAYFKHVIQLYQHYLLYYRRPSRCNASLISLRANSLIAGESQRSVVIR